MFSFPAIKTKKQVNRQRKKEVFKERRPSLALQKEIFIGIFSQSYPYLL